MLRRWKVSKCDCTDPRTDTLAVNLCWMCANRNARTYHGGIKPSCGDHRRKNRNMTRLWKSHTCALRIQILKICQWYEIKLEQMHSLDKSVRATSSSAKRGPFLLLQDQKRHSGVTKSSKSTVQISIWWPDFIKDINFDRICLLDTKSGIVMLMLLLYTQLQ